VVEADGARRHHLDSLRSKAKVLKGRGRDRVKEVVLLQTLLGEGFERLSLRKGFGWRAFG
jgi:hypothetical protein